MSAEEQDPPEEKTAAQARAEEQAQAQAAQQAELAEEETAAEEKPAPKRRAKKAPAASSGDADAKKKAKPKAKAKAPEAPAAEESQGEEKKGEEPPAQEEPQGQKKPEKATPPSARSRSGSRARRGAGGAPRRRVVRARARYVRTSARKARMVSGHLCGKTVEQARAILAFTPREVARDWSKLLESAVANAENNHELLQEDLVVREAYADEGPTIKRFRPRAQGRATPINKRTSHLTITLAPGD